ncbi:hypothetical protein I6U48_02945 [Clostridium sp. PL3]|uniref:Membrane protein NfeD2 N-terminal transmembrane domain-containing protein n=1 Tax=Clostridium thailandense TaxID=2794346 RepID=A0A949TRB8_9CLOT|nr:hypothetical protein [Clostridium thailandense]MBV7271871.1 hypothetical protein [Clostridium thailandense]
MEYVYTIVFFIGVIYTLVTFLLGGLFDIVNLGFHIDTHVDTHSSGSIFTVFPLKPITIVSFITIFGGVGILGNYYKVNKILTFILAVALGIMVSFILYKFIVVPLFKAQNTSAVSQDKLIGINAIVISPILENGFGVISYTVNGSKYNGPAQHISGKAVLQGEDVIIYEIKNNVFYVQPLNE